MSALEFRYHRGGVYLPCLQLWLDPQQAQTGRQRVFVSHAHSDHTGAHREVILSAPTSRLMRARIGGRRLEHVLPFGEPRRFETEGIGWRITLLPAGHILGSAMALIEADGESLLFTGDFKMRPGFSAESCDASLARGTDVLIMETTFGRPEYRFPSASEVMESVVRFCRETIGNGETPVLFGYSLGKTQELLGGLAEARLPIVLHPSAHELTRVYEELGQKFPPHEKFHGQPFDGKVLICPPMSRLAATMREFCRVRTAVVTGWAIDRSCRFRSRVDAAFPLSDHADFPDLVEFVNQIMPKRVCTLHGFAADFAQTLREMGFDARALGVQEQMTLPLEIGRSASGPSRPEFGGRGTLPVSYPAETRG